MNEIGAVYATCSPHRVALCVQHVRNYYLDEFADQLVALLPEWTRWLAARKAIPPELADRCLSDARGQSTRRAAGTEVLPTTKPVSSNRHLPGPTPLVASFVRFRPRS